MYWSKMYFLRDVYMHPNYSHSFKGTTHLLDSVNFLTGGHLQIENMIFDHVIQDHGNLRGTPPRNSRPY